MICYVSKPMFDLFRRHLELKEIQKQAIERGYAEYNQTTSAWQWKGDTECK